MLISQSQQQQVKGNIVHQAFKKMEGENVLISTYSIPMQEDDELWDHEKPNQVSAILFETYSYDSCCTHELRYNEEEFDELFRFNAELMNPNHRAGRYHWVGQRLYFSPSPDGKQGRKLSCSEVGPTPEDCHLLKFSKSEIPCTRGGTYEERQALRDNMDDLEKKRDSNIKAKQEASKKRFCEQVQKDQAMLAEQKAIRMERIAEEKASRQERLAREAEEESYGVAKAAALNLNRERHIAQKVLDRDAYMEQRLKAQTSQWKEQDSEEYEKMQEAKEIARQKHAELQEMLEKERLDLIALEKKRERYLHEYDKKQVAKRAEQKAKIQKKKEEIEREKQALKEIKTDIIVDERKATGSRVVKFDNLFQKVTKMFEMRKSFSERVNEEKKPKQKVEKQATAADADAADADDLDNVEESQEVDNVADEDLMAEESLSQKELARRRAHELYNKQGEGKKKNQILNQKRGEAAQKRAEDRKARVAERRRQDLLVQNEKTYAADKARAERISKRRAQKQAEERMLKQRHQAVENLESLRSKRIARKRAAMASPERKA